MNSPLTKTLALAILAAVTSGTAAYFYPWPVEVTQSAIVGTPLFEPYDSSSVRQIRIQKFNDDRGGLDQIILRRKGEKWIVPAKKDFIASNARQISLAASSLIESTVLEEVTDQQQAYLDYSLVDPDDYLKTTNRSALGTKIILQDRDLKEIASLIVGTQVKDDPTNLQHFVRIPGQPNVYVINFDTAALQTDFTRWIDPQLLDLDPNNLEAVTNVEVLNYKINPEQLGTASPQRNYRAEMKLVRQQNQILVNLLSVDLPQGEDQWTKTELTQKVGQPFQSLGLQALAIYFPDVQLKNKDVAELLQAPKPDAGANVFDSMKPYGFLKTGFENGVYNFDAVGGQVSVATFDGVVITLYIGGIAEKSDATDLQLNYYIMLCAGVDESILPVPDQPADPDDKVYLRSVEEREAKIKAARLRADGLNQRYAPWYYVVTEDVINNLRPDVNLGLVQPTTTPQAPPTDPPTDPPTESNAESKTDAATTPDQEKSASDEPSK